MAGYTLSSNNKTKTTPQTKHKLRSISHLKHFPFYSTPCNFCNGSGQIQKTANYTSASLKIQNIELI